MSTPAFALIGADGEIEHSTETFRLRHEDTVELCRQSPQIESVLAGDADRALVDLQGVSGEAEAVIDAAGTRHVLLTLASHPGAPVLAEPASLFAEALEDSPAIGWQKDLDGRYIQINRTFTTLLGLPADRAQGKTDGELEPRETVDGPRVHERGESPDEPLQFEYSVPTFDKRPAMAVLRFPVRDAGGNPIAVCGVAAPFDQARVAREEAARLIEIERWARLDPGAVRTEVLTEWGVLASPAGTGRVVPLRPSQPVVARRRPAADDDQALEARRAQEVASAQAAQRVEELETTLAIERARSEGLERTLTQARAEAEAARADAELAARRAEQLERDVPQLRARVERAEDEAAQWHEHVERADVQVEQARARAEGSEARAEELRARAEQAEERAAEAKAQLKQAREEAEDTEHQLRQARIRAEEAEAEARLVRTRAEEAEALLGQARSRAEEAEAETRQARLRAEESEDAVRQLRLRAEEAEAEAKRAHARADEAITEAEQARVRAARAEAEAEQARSEPATAGADALQARADAEQARAEADRALAEAEQARGAAEQARADWEQAQAEVEQAREEAEQARAEIERAVAEGAQFRAEAEEAAAEAAQLRSRAEEEHGAVAAALAERDAALAKVEALTHELKRERHEVASSAMTAERARQLLAALTHERELTTALVTGRERTDELMRALTAAENADAVHQPPGRGAVRWSAQAERRLVEALRRAPNQATALTEAAAVLGSEGGWDAVLAWVPDEGENLGCAARWTAPGSPEGLGTVDRPARERRASLLGQAMMASTPTWLADLEATGDDLLTEAAAHGVRSALLLPVRAGTDTVCLLELLTCDHVDPDPRIASSLETAALQVGRFVAELG